jgi:hypothetical protein
MHPPATSPGNQRRGNQTRNGNLPEQAQVFAQQIALGFPDQPRLVDRTAAVPSRAPGSGLPFAVVPLEENRRNTNAVKIPHNALKGSACQRRQCFHSLEITQTLQLRASSSFDWDSS